MFDPFGLKKDPEEAPEKPASPAPAPAAEPTGPAPGFSTRVLAAFLVFDSLFVIVFGGALAAKFYEHLSAPAPVLKGAPPPKKAKTPEPPAAAPDAPPPAPVAPSAPKPEPPAAAPKAPEPPPPAAAAAAAAAPAKTKALPVEFKLKQAGAKKVELAGAFIVRGGKAPMAKNGDGSWTVTLYLIPDTYRYNFLVDGKKIIDPQNPNVSRGASVVTIP